MTARRKPIIEAPAYWLLERPASSSASKFARDAGNGGIGGFPPCRNGGRIARPLLPLASGLPLAFAMLDDVAE
jgi:hypothetical protein